MSIVISWCLLSTLTPSDENHRTQNVEKRVRFHLLSMRELSFLKDMMSPDGLSSSTHTTNLYDIIFYNFPKETIEYMLFVEST